MEKETISFVEIREASIPRVVYAVLLEELLKIEKGATRRVFKVEDFTCNLFVHLDECYSLGSCASGMVCDLFVARGGECHSRGRFLANVKKSRPPAPGSLRLPLY